MSYTKVKWGMLFALMLAFWLGTQASVLAAPLTAQTARIYGATRIETAIKVSQQGWQQADTVLLARADDFPDSLVAVPLSHRLNAPILLTYPAALDPAVLAEINRLGAQNIILLGGEGALGEKITVPLFKAGKALDRIGGMDRYDTAAKVAERLGVKGQAILTSGEDFPDALAVGPYAGITETPIFLTGKKELPEITRATMASLDKKGMANGGEGISRTLVIGGEGVIPSKTLDGLMNINRLGGKDRYETAAKVYWFAQEQFGPDGLNQQAAYLVTGEDFPDALVTGALAAKQSAWLFMSAGTDLSAFTYSALGGATLSSTTVTLIGGVPVLSDKVKGTVEGKIQPPYLLAGVTIVVDPGHGGKDPGAVGLNGTQEKHINLAIGLDLADILRGAGANVVLTRTGDYLPTGANYKELTDLQTRVKIAADKQADLFISIHNNSAGNPDAYGTETYYSSKNPSSAGSVQLAQAVQGRVIKELAGYNRGKYENRGVKDSGFVVVRDTTMPAILIELGFLTNAAEEQLLTNSEYQQKAAMGIYRGILVYKGY